MLIVLTSQPLFSVPFCIYIIKSNCPRSFHSSCTLGKRARDACHSLTITTLLLKICSQKFTGCSAPFLLRGQMARAQPTQHTGMSQMGLSSQLPWAKPQIPSVKHVPRTQKWAEHFTCKISLPQCFQDLAHLMKCVLCISFLTVI